uniref:Uncharacterized protein n=1 Tax=Anguilla anguilla TaxID=7936 RepID=A0A0E9XXX0_ANGAN
MALYKSDRVFSVSVMVLCFRLYLSLLGRQMAALLFCVLLVPCLIVLLFSIVQLLVFGCLVFPSLSVA